MQTSLEDRVARALWEIECNPYKDIDEYREAARVAISAILDNTEISEQLVRELCEDLTGKKCVDLDMQEVDLPCLNPRDLGENFRFGLQYMCATAQTKQ